jgi:hypothetical protein
MCIDAVEMLPPEDWPQVVERFRRALRPGGWLYMTVELVPETEIQAMNQATRESGVPAIDREVIWQPVGYYHYYPPLDQVRAWLRQERFAIEEELEGPWHEGRYAYHHLLARLNEAD